MAAKDELQTALKTKYGINKNISQSLSKEECERLLYLLSSESGALKLVESFVQKNEDLGENNRLFGQKRSQAEKKLASLKAEYDDLQETIKNLSASKLILEERKRQLEQERSSLEADISRLSVENNGLGLKVKNLVSEKDTLVEVNTQLKKDNKDLKNLLDRIKLELVVHLKNAIKSKDIIEIKKVITKLIKWITG